MVFLFVDALLIAMVTAFSSQSDVAWVSQSIA